MGEQQPDDPLAKLIRVGIQALREGDRAGARSLFRALAQRHPGDVRLWLWFSAASDSVDERRIALRRAHDLDPDNPLVLKGMDALGMLPADEPPADEPLTEQGADRRLRSLRWTFVVLALLLMLMILVVLWLPGAWARRAAPSPTAMLAASPGPTSALPAAQAPRSPLPLATPQAASAVPTPSALVRSTPVPPGSFLERDGWRYGLLGGPQSATLDAIGPLVPQGRFVVVLLTVANSGDAPRPLDLSQIALIDMLGRSYTPLPEASARYLEAAGRGVAGDLSAGEAVPNSGGNLSVPLVFDVPSDAGDLLLAIGSGADQMVWGVRR